MMTKPYIAAWALFAFHFGTTQAAESSKRSIHPEFMALVVGSNQGGPGQEDLRFAERDAQQISQVLIELGGFQPEQVRLLLSPNLKQLMESIQNVRQLLETRRQQGEPMLFLFYYSGHARARALNIGEEEISLDQLRAQLLSLPAKVTVAILDACQTGAISNVKGAEPAADFSFNSINQLNNAGIVVMASSSASELSQESESLEASFFTHHLVVGLRGAADADGDGQVTLSEAYRYAYNRTLQDTAATAVGKQHVTLETELKGKGEMVLTRPMQASAHLLLPKDLAGETLVLRNPGRAVMAEIDKTVGESVKLGLPAGAYQTLSRAGNRMYRCDLDLHEDQTQELDLSACVEESIDDTKSKGDPTKATWGLELGVGGSHQISDRYNQRLNDFGFEQQSTLLPFTPSLSLALTRSFGPYLSLSLEFDTLDFLSFERESRDQINTSHQQDFEWRSFGLNLGVRGGLPILNGLLEPYLELSGGMSMGITTYRDPAVGTNDKQTYVGYSLKALLGIQCMPWRHVGFFAQGRFISAAAVKNLIGDLHDSGGLGLVFGIRGAL